MKSYKRTVTVYELDNGFCVEAVKDGNVTEFYLYRKGYGVKSLIFGLFDVDEATEVSYVENINEEYFIDYLATYGDGDECEVCLI